YVRAAADAVELAAVERAGDEVTGRPRRVRALPPLVGVVVVDTERERVLRGRAVVTVGEVEVIAVRVAVDAGAERAAAGWRRRVARARRDRAQGRPAQGSRAVSADGEDRTE